MKLTSPEFVSAGALLLVLGKMALQLWLESINRKYSRQRQSPPSGVSTEKFDTAVYEKSVAYTLAKSRFESFEIIFNAAILILVLFSGLLPAMFEWFIEQGGRGALVQSSYLFVIGVLFSLLGMPLEWYSQFIIEERFGFNTMTKKLWWIDRAKALLLGGVIGIPMLLLLVKIVEWTGQNWWIWGWAAMLLFQLIMMVLAPILILPLFNKFIPLKEGSLRKRLLTLGERSGFYAQNILVMDGSKRSRHSNAFFTGFSKWRKIVLFDTLVQQLDEAELEAVLAHEIGHYKKRHIPKMLFSSAILSFGGFFMVAWLAEQEWFYRAFGFSQGSIVPALLLFTLLSGTITFYFSPIGNFVARRFEYEADAFASRMTHGPHALITSLRKMTEKNLSNLTPHPIYSAVYYSHPTLFEREKALLKEEEKLHRTETA
ncbi:MAG: M48 family metallopeptidase [Verrucomicrobiota bacterium]|nr:M48 family metallopeptidase [Verrucomicrobiota bacterium]